jgi:DNA-binding NtrC family response regulator
MPTLSGSQLLIRIKEKHPNAQAIIMTSGKDTAALDRDTKSFAIVEKNHFIFFDEIDLLVRDFMKKHSA